MHMNKKRNIELDVLKGILIIIVVFRHVFQVVALDTDTDYLSNLMAAVEMPLFILISGYFGSREISKHESETLLHIIRRKTIAYIIPFFSYYIIFKFIFDPASIENNLFKAFFELLSNITLSLWFLYVIWVLSIILNVAVHIACRVFNQIKNAWLPVAIIYYFFVVIIGVFIIQFRGSAFLGIKYVMYYSVYYFIGYFIHYHINVKPILRNDVAGFISAIVYFVGCRYYKVLILPDNIVGIIIRFILAISGSIIIYRLSCKMLHLKKGQPLQYIGNKTLEIYYIHSFLMRIIDIIPEKTLMSYYGIQKSILLSIVLIILIPIIYIIISENQYLSFVIFGKKTQNFNGSKKEIIQTK